MFHKRPGEERSSCSFFPIKSTQSRGKKRRKVKRVYAGPQRKERGSLTQGNRRRRHPGGTPEGGAHRGKRCGVGDRASYQEKGTRTMMEEKTTGQREGWGCQGSARGKCHSEPGEGRVRAQAPRRVEEQPLALAAPGRSSLTAPGQWSLPGAPGPRKWEAASQNPRAGGGFTFAGGWRRSSPSSARRRLHVPSGMRHRRPRPFSLSFSPPGPVAAGSFAAAPTPPLLPPPLRGSPWTSPSSPRLASAEHQRACVASAPAVTRPSQLTSALPPCAPLPGRHCPTFCDPFAVFRETPRALRPPFRLSGTTRA